MSWVDWAKLIGGGAGAVFTGGATLPIAASGLSGVLGGAAKAGQEQNNKADQLKLLLENAKLNRDKFALDAPATRLQTGLKAGMAAGAAPSTMDWGEKGFVPGAIAKGQAPMPKRTGGPSGALASLAGNSDAKQLSNTVLHDQLIAQLRGGTTGGGSRVGGDMSAGTDSAMPTGIGEESTGDKVLGGASLATSILSMLLKAKGQQSGGGSSDTSGLFGDGSGDWESSGIG